MREFIVVNIGNILVYILFPTHGVYHWGIFVGSAMSFIITLLYKKENNDPS